MGELGFRKSVYCLQTGRQVVLHEVDESIWNIVAMGCSFGSNLQRQECLSQGIPNVALRFQHLYFFMNCREAIVSNDTSFLYTPSAFHFVFESKLNLRIFVLKSQLWPPETSIQL